MIPKNREPTHPGELLADILADMKMTQQQLADKIGVTVQTVNTLIKKKKGVTASMAVKLGDAFKTSAEMWMNAQTAWDIWHVRHQARRAG